MNKILLVLAGISLSVPVLAEETAAPATEAPAPAAVAAPAEQSRTAGSVTRATFTTAVAEREPVGSIDKLTADTDKVYYFTELRGMAGQTVTHRWEYNGKVMAEVPFTVSGPRWRVYSSKNLQEGWTGEWKVSVIDQAGSTLAVNTFTYEKAAAAPASADTAPASPPSSPATEENPMNQ